MQFRCCMSSQCCRKPAVQLSLPILKAYCSGDLITYNVIVLAHSEHIVHVHTSTLNPFIYELSVG